jgi:hypothetical protein
LVNCCLQPAPRRADDGSLYIHCGERNANVRTRFTLTIPAVALAAALTACGDGGPSKADFTTKADSSCAAGNTAVSTTAKPTNAAQVATAAGTVVSTVDGLVGTLRAMKAPGGDDKVKIDGFITALADVSAPAKALQEAAGKNDDAAMSKATTELQAKVDAAAGSASAYGMTQCGTGLKPAAAPLFDGTKSVVKGTYVTKAETLCRDAYRKADAIAAPGNSLASLGRYLDAFLVVSNKLATDLKALPAPPGDETTVAEFNAAMETLNNKFKETTAAAKANNARLVVGLSDELDVATTALNAKLDAYGLKTCGTSGI